MTEKTADAVSRAWWGLVALPLVLCGWLVYRYGVDVPFWDEWDIARLLQIVDDGTLSPSDLFGQHNEHRMFVPRAVQLLASVIAGWDTRIGMWVTQALLIGMVGMCVVLWRRHAPEHGRRWSILTLALVAGLLVSPAQHQNLFWGFQLAFYVPAACLLGSVVAASSPTLGYPAALALVAVLSTLASFSILPGLLAWPLAAAAVALSRGFSWPRHRVAWLAFAITCTLVIGSYSLGYQRPVQTPQIALFDPLGLIAGTAVCLGGSLTWGGHRVPFAMVLGFVLIATFITQTVSVWRRRADPLLVSRAVPWIVMGSFGLFSAAAIAAGRVGFGYVALLESRYHALTVWTFVATLMLFDTLRVRVGTRGMALAWAVACVAAILLSATALPTHLADVRRVYQEHLQSLAIYNFAESVPSALPMLPPWVDWEPIRERLRHVETAGWRPRRQQRLVWIDTRQEREQCTNGTVEFSARADRHLMAGGWAYLPLADRPADGVLVVEQQSRRIAAVQAPLIGRRDIGDKFRSSDALVTGWTVDADVGSEGPIEFWALDAKTMRAYPLCNAR